MLAASLLGSLPAYSQDDTVFNTATISMIKDGGATVVIRSNTDTFKVYAAPPEPSDAQITFFRADPSSELTLTWSPHLTKQSDGSLLVNQDTPRSPFFSSERSYIARVRKAQSVSLGEAFFLAVDDADQNYDPNAADRIELQFIVGDDRESVILVETGTDTGRFASYFQPVMSAPQPANGIIESRVGSSLVTQYRDTRPNNQILSPEFEVATPCRVFDSVSGELLDGVSLTLVDARTGLPAEVYGADGSSIYPATVISGQAVTDSSGNHYEVGDGEFIFPRFESGRYYIRANLSEDSGYNFPSQKTNSTLQALPLTPLVTDASRGAEFESDAAPLAIDIPLDPLEGNLSLSLALDATSASQGDLVEARLRVRNQNALLDLAAPQIELDLPYGFRLVSDSISQDGTALELSSKNRIGEQIALDLNPISRNTESELSLLLRLSHPPQGTATIGATLIAGAKRSNTAKVSLSVQDALMSQSALVVGRVLEYRDGQYTTNGVPNVSLLTETGTIAITDATGRFHFDGLKPGPHLIQIDLASLPAGSAPVLPTGQIRGKAHSRIVDLSPGTLWRTDFFIEAKETELRTAKPEASGPLADELSPYDPDWIENAPIDYAWLTPEANELPSNPSLKIAVKHRPGFQLELSIDDKPVSGIFYEGKITRQDKKQAISFWKGIPLSEGSHTVTLVRRDRFGNERSKETRTVHYSGPAVSAKLLREASTLVADGNTHPIVAVQLFDADGFPAREGSLGTFTVEDPFEARRPVNEELRLRPGMAASRNTFTIGKNGIAKLELMPTTIAADARISIPLAGDQIEILAPLFSDRQDWVIVGIASGTTTHRTLKGAMEALPSGIEADGFSDDGRIALFAKGRVKGDWLLTLAYDSDKQAATRDSLQDAVDPDAYYMLYGDQSQRLESAPSTEKLYLRLEKEAYAALYGTFSLDWKPLSFLRLQTQMQGVKFDHRGTRFKASGFQTRSGLRLAREEFLAHGAAGAYRLSRGEIAPFSEAITVEVRDRTRPTITLEEKRLARNLDYFIDYIDGEIRLNKPLFRVNDDLNPQYLVIHYETEKDTAGKTRGLRLSHQTTDAVQLGFTSVQQEDDFGDRSLHAIDAQVQFGQRSVARIEIGQSHKDGSSQNAYAAQLDHRTEKSTTSIKLSETEAGFGLQNVSLAKQGTRHFSIEHDIDTREHWTLQQRFYRDTELEDGSTTAVAEAATRFDNGMYGASLGVRIIEEEPEGPEDTQRSLQATASLGKRFLQDRLDLSITREQTITGESDSSDFPTRTVLAGDLRFSESLGLRAQQVWEKRDGETHTQSRIGFEAEPWQGFELSSLISNTPQSGQSLENSIAQTFQFSRNLELEAGWETIRDLDTDPSEEADSLYGEIHYRDEKNSFDVRFERYFANELDRVGFAASATREENSALGYLATLRIDERDTNDGRDNASFDARFGIAWRSNDGRFSLLNRLESKHDKRSGDDSDHETWKLINNLHFNYRRNANSQLSLHLGLKDTRDTRDDERRQGSAYFIGAQFRHALNERWDFGVHSRALGSFDADTLDYSYGAEVGRRLGDSAWLSIGYNVDGVADDDFAGSEYTQSGFYLRFRLSFDQNSIGGLLKKGVEE